MATLCDLLPESAHYPSTNHAPMMLVNQRPVLAYDATTSETAYWSFVAPQGITTPLTLVISYMMASATTGGIAFDAALEAVSAGDATDLDAGSSFATVNTGTDTVPGTAGFMKQVSIPLTNNDGIAAGDRCRLSIARATANASDTATGDLYMIGAELRDAA